MQEVQRQLAEWSRQRPERAVKRPEAGLVQQLVVWRSLFSSSGLEEELERCLPLLRRCEERYKSFKERYPEPLDSFRDDAAYLELVEMARVNEVAFHDAWDDFLEVDDDLEGGGDLDALGCVDVVYATELRDQYGPFLKVHALTRGGKVLYANTDWEFWDARPEFARVALGGPSFRFRRL